MRLKDKVAIVTGAASGIGRSVAQVFAREGCHLALVDINEAGLNETRASLSGVEVIAVQADVRAPQTCSGPSTRPWTRMGD